MNRRKFLLTAAAGAAGCSRRPQSPWRTLTMEEATTLEAWCDCLIPEDADPGAKSAREGQWYPARGGALFDKLHHDFRTLPVVAEDLGSITPDVEELRKRFGFPGMRVLQFAFDGSPRNPHLPHNHTHDSVVYTGTHDNDTTVGWWSKRSAEEAERVEYYLNVDRNGVTDSMKRACLASVGQLAILPMQDLLGLDSSARLNTPGTTRGNWSWKVPAEGLTASLAQQLRRLNRCYGRIPAPQPSA